MTQQALRPAFPPEAQKQFDSLLAQYDGLRIAGNMQNPPIAKPACDTVVKMLEQIPRDNRWWSDLSQLEICLTEYFADATVRAQLSSWRRKFREVAGETRYAAYIASATCAGADPIDAVRADLAECIRGVYYFYAGYGIAANSRDDLIRELFRFSAAIIASECLVLIVLAAANTMGAGWQIEDETRKQLILATWTSIVAVVGSLVSVQRRLEDPKVDADPYFRYIQTSADRLSISFSSPFFGAVFGYLLYALVAGKLILGGTSPDMASPGMAWISLILVMGFAAGFAEQLVPDALTRIAARAMGSVSDGSSSPPPSGGAPLSASKRNAALGAEMTESANGISFSKQ